MRGVFYGMRELVGVGTLVCARYARYITYDKRCMRVANAASSLHNLVDEPILSEPTFSSDFNVVYTLKFIISILTVFTISTCLSFYLARWIY